MSQRSKSLRYFFFDIVAKAREIKLYALRAKAAVVENKLSIVKDFLDKIVELEKTEIKDIDRFNKLILYRKAKIWDKLVLETSFVMFTRNRLLPFASSFAEELDIFFRLKKSLDHVLGKKVGLKFLDFEADLKAGIFIDEQMLLDADSLGNEIKHPLIIPHHDIGLSFDKIFSDYTYICVLGVMSYSVLTKSFFHNIQKRNVMIKARNFYAKLAFDFDSDFDMLVIDIKNMTDDIRKLNRKLSYFSDKLGVLSSKTVMKDLSDDYSRFLVSSRKKISMILERFELECQKLHDPITKYVVREREKLQDVLDRAEL